MSKKIFAVLAALLCLSSWAFAGGTRQNTKSGVPTVKWYNFKPHNGNWEADIAKIADYTEEKIGVRFEIYEYSDVNLNTIISTGEDWDISFMNMFLFNRYVGQGAYWNLTDAVEKVTPALKATIPQAVWDGVKVKGGYYAVPTYKDSAATNYVIWDEAYVKKYNVDVSKTSWADLDRIFRQIKAGEGSRFYPISTGKAGQGALVDRFRYDSFGLGIRALGVRINDPTARLVNLLEQPDIIEGYKYLHQWYVDGIINPDAPVLEAGPSVYMFGTGQGWPSAWATGGNGVEKVVTYKLTDSVYSTDSIQGSMNVINANSRYKEESLKLLELANTDRKFRDMLGWGLEGTDFEYATPTTIRRLNDRWIAWQGYMQAQFFNKSTEVGSYTWDEVRELNERAVKSPLLGFVSDTTSFVNELAQIQTIQEKYWYDLSNGSANTDVIIPQFIAEMKAAGLDKIFTEVQRQIDVFLASR